MNTIQILNIALIVVLVLILLLGLVSVLIVIKIRQGKKQESDEQIKVKQPAKEKNNLITRTGENINSIYKFMEFDEIVDSMISRKNNKQYVMVIECKGINYDLLSDEEKQAVEVGFIGMLNTLRFPIQLYVQTRTLNLTDMIKKYLNKTDEIKEQINRLKVQKQSALNASDIETAKKIQVEINRKQNILEYGESIESYTMKISGSRNILQQKTYIIVSYFPSEYGDISKYSKEEINDIAFSELYTRCQSLIRTLASAEVTGKVLSSEELGELLYIAYNRDEAEKYTIKNALDSDYSRLYSTAKDVMDERKKKIEQQIERNASRIAAQSIIKADKISREERVKRTKQRAKEMLEEYKEELSVPLYEESKKQIEQASPEEVLNENSARRTTKK